MVSPLHTDVFIMFFIFLYFFVFLQQSKMKFIVVLFAIIGLAVGQVPGFGGCPEFESQPDFDMNKVCVLISSNVNL